MTSYTEELKAAVLQRGLTGASFAYWDGNQLHTAVAGVRNSVTQDPVTVDTVMHIGSITKVLNAVLFMQLVDEGRLRLEDRVASHLPDLRLADDAALGAITCRMLLNHTSGINGDWLPEHGPDQERIVDAVTRCKGLDQLFPPGEATSYCNIATVIAGYLTQKLRGESWYSLVRDRIFAPLGMSRALADITDVPRFRCSIGDLTDLATGKPVQTTRAFLSPSFAPAGSTVMTSATDLIVFARALLCAARRGDAVSLVSQDSAAEMARPMTTFVSPALGMGLGWNVLPGGVLTHSGAGPGVYSVLYAHPESGRALALLTNCDRGGALAALITEPIVASWTGIPRYIPRPQSGGVDTRRYDGIYDSNLQHAEITRLDDGHLYLRLSLKMPLYDTSPFGALAQVRPPSRLVPLGADTFSTDSVVPGAPSIELKFVRPDARGRMTRVGLGYRILVRSA